MFSWANPDDRPSSVHLPSVPEFHAGANVATTVTNVAITTQPSLTVMEGQPFAVQPTLRVTDTTGAGVAGRKVFALVTVANGFVYVLCRCVCCRADDTRPVLLTVVLAVVLAVVLTVVFTVVVL